MNRYQKPNYPLGFYRRQSLFMYGHNRSPIPERKLGNYVIVQYTIKSGQIIHIGTIPRHGGSLCKTTVYALRRQLRKLFAGTNQYFTVMRL